jgi:hypothetical protein
MIPNLGNSWQEVDHRIREFRSFVPREMVRVFLVSLVSALAVSAAAADPSPPQEAPSAVTPLDQSAVASNYRGRYDDGRGHDWWDRYGGEDDEDDDDDNGGGGHGKWSHGVGDKSPWDSRGRGHDGYPGREDGGGWHGRGHRGGDNGDNHGYGGWRERGHGYEGEVKSPSGDHSPRSFGGDGKYDHGYKGAHHWGDGGHDGRGYDREGEGYHGHKEAKHWGDRGHEDDKGEGHGGEGYNGHKEAKHWGDGGHDDKGESHGGEGYNGHKEAKHGGKGGHNGKGEGRGGEDYDGHKDARHWGGGGDKGDGYGGEGYHGHREDKHWGDGDREDDKGKEHKGEGYGGHKDAKHSGDGGYHHKDDDREGNGAYGGHKDSGYHGDKDVGHKPSGGDEGHGHKDGRGDTHGDREDDDKSTHKRGRDNSPNKDKYPRQKNRDGQDAPKRPWQDSDSDDVPAKTIPVAQQLRKDTEAFVSDTLGWLTDTVSDDVASTLVIDTTFSLTKNEFAELQRGPCGSTGFSNVFPILQKFITNPQDINVLDKDVKQIAWTPSATCTTEEDSSEAEGAIYASFQVLCVDQVLLNVSIASSGSTPSVRGEAVEDASFYINVDIMNGRIRASDAQGSIVGVLKNRHYPEDAAAVQKDWKTGLAECAAASQLSVVGVVGGGWSIYTQRDTNGSNDSGDYQVAAVGYTESFAFSFPSSDKPAAPATPDNVATPASITNPVPAPPSSAGDEADAVAVAASGASAYVQAGVGCHYSVGAPKVCAGHAVMSQLSSFYQSSPASTGFSFTRRAGTTAPNALIAPMAATGVLFVVAFVGVAVVTTQRRSGYRPLENESQA